MKLAYAALPLFVLDGAAPAADPARYMTAELIAASATPAPGSSSILVGIRMTPRPGWHGYWSNPGDSGIAPTVRWSAPKGVTFGPLLHPAPTLLTADGMSSFVHEGRHVLLSRLRIARSVAPGTAIPITAALSWAACTATQCVPLHATLSLQLAAGNGAKGPDWQELNAAAAKLPPRVAGGTFVDDGKSLRLFTPALKVDLSAAHFFPDAPGVFQPAAARAERIGGGVQITGPASDEVPRSISGVLSDGNNAYRLSFTRKPQAVRPFADARPASHDALGGVQQAAGGNVAEDPATVSPDSKGGSGHSWFWLGLVAAILGLSLVLTARRSRAR